MGVYKLVLHPVAGHLDPALAPELTGCVDALGLIGRPFFLDGRRHFLTGPRFLELISLVGCSPHLELDPPGDAEALEPAARNGRFCHLGLRPEDPPLLRTGPRARPRCPCCNAAQPVAELVATPAGMRCPGCGETTSAGAWRWREMGGFSNFFIDIWSIYPAEGIPQPALLAALEELSGLPWTHCYVED